MTIGESLSAMAPPIEGYRHINEKPNHNICWAGFQNIHRYRTWWDRRLERALAEFDGAQRSRRQEASQARAEAQAARQAEAHAQKLELAANRDRRQHELHELRIALAREKLTTEQAKQANAQAEAGLRHLEAFVNASGPITEEEFLSEHGFVSQTTGAAVSLAPDSTPEAGGREPEAGLPVAAGDFFPLGFVSQNRQSSGATGSFQRHESLNSQAA